MMVAVDYTSAIKDNTAAETSGDFLEDFDEVDDQLPFKDIILALCGAIAATFALCMLAIFSRYCCCKKQQQQQQQGDKKKNNKDQDCSEAGKVNDDGGTQDSAVPGSRGYDTDCEKSGQRTAGEEHGDHSNDKVSTDQGKSSREGGSSKKKRGMFAKKDCQGSKAVSVRDRVLVLETHHDPTAEEEKPSPTNVKLRPDGSKPKKKKPTSKAFEEFESSGILIGFGNVPKKRASSENDDDPEGAEGEAPMAGRAEEDEEEGEGEGEGEGEVEGHQQGGASIGTMDSGQGSSRSNTNSLSRLTDDEGIHTMDEDDEFAAVTRNSEILKSFRRAPPPKNRTRARRSIRKKGNVQRELQDMQTSFEPCESPKEEDEEHRGNVRPSVSFSTPCTSGPGAGRQATPPRSTASHGNLDNASASSDNTLDSTTQAPPGDNLRTCLERSKSGSGRERGEAAEGASQQSGAPSADAGTRPILSTSLEMLKGGSKGAGDQRPRSGLQPSAQPPHQSRLHPQQPPPSSSSSSAAAFAFSSCASPSAPGGLKPAYSGQLRPKSFHCDGQAKSGGRGVSDRDIFARITHADDGESAGVARGAGESPRSPKSLRKWDSEWSGLQRALPAKDALRAAGDDADGNTDPSSQGQDAPSFLEARKKFQETAI